MVTVIVYKAVQWSQMLFDEKLQCNVYRERSSDKEKQDGSTNTRTNKCQLLQLYQAVDSKNLYLEFMQHSNSLAAPWPNLAVLDKTTNLMSITVSFKFQSKGYQGPITMLCTSQELSRV